MSKNGSFKKSLFGFKSTDVLSYIEKTQSEALAEKEEYTAHTAELEKQNSALSDRVRELESQMETIKQQADSAASEALSDKSIISEKEAELSNLRSRNDTLEAKLAACHTEIDTLTNSVTALKTELDNTVSISNQIGHIFVDAKAAANLIVESANQEAKGIELTAAECASATVNHIDLSYMELQALRDNLQSTFNEFCKRLSAAGAILNNTKAKINASRNKNEQEQNYVAEASQTLESASQNVKNVVSLENYDTPDASRTAFEPNTITSIRFM